MRIMRSILAGALAVMLTTACSDSTDPGDVTGADLVGTWDATSAVFTPDAGGTAIDVVLLGATFEITLNAEGGYTATFIEQPGGTPELEIGTYTVANGVLTLTPVGADVETFTIDSLDGNSLVITDTNAEFDFNDDGTDEPANLTVRLAKQ